MPSLNHTHVFLGPSYKSQKKKMDEAKAALLEALRLKLEAQLDAADAAAGEASKQ